MRIWSGAQIKLCYSNMFHLRRTWRLLRSPFLRLRCSGDGGLANGWIMGQYDDCLDALHIRPSELHAPERRCVVPSPWHDIFGVVVVLCLFLALDDATSHVGVAHRHPFALSLIHI